MFLPQHPSINASACPCISSTSSYLPCLLNSKGLHRTSYIFSAMIRHKVVYIWRFHNAILSGNGFMEQFYSFMKISWGKRICLVQIRDGTPEHKVRRKARVSGLHDQKGNPCDCGMYTNTDLHINGISGAVLVRSVKKGLYLSIGGSAMFRFHHAGSSLEGTYCFFTTANPARQKQADLIFPKNHPGLGPPCNPMYLRNRYSEGGVIIFPTRNFIQ